MTNKEIKELRERLKLTQAQLGERLGVHFITISRWERGLSAPHPTFITAMQRLEIPQEPPKVKAAVVAEKPIKAFTKEAQLKVAKK